MMENTLHVQTKVPANGVDTSDVAISENNDLISVKGAQKANEALFNYMYNILNDGRQEAQQLRRKQKITYWLLIVLSTTMFVVGLVLFTGPVWFYFVTEGASWVNVILPGILGVGDLVALYQFKPLARIQKLMGDMSQMTVAINCFQTRVALRLLETDAQKRNTIGAASDHLKAIANDTVRVIDQHFEKWLSKELNVEPSTKQG